MFGVKMKHVIKIELFKVMRKPITACLLIPLFLPLFYSISEITNASYIDVEGSFNMYMSVSVYWKMLQYICLPQILLALVATQNFGYELEDGQIKIMLLKGCTRKKMLCCKVVVNIILLLGSYVIFFAFSYIIEWILQGQQFDMSTFLSWIAADHARFLIVDAIYLVNIIMISNIVICLCVYIKPFASFMIGVGISLMCILLQYFPKIKYCIPMYVADQLTNCEISIVVAVVALICYVAMSMIPIVIALKKFDYMDIK